MIESGKSSTISDYSLLDKIYQYYGEGNQFYEELLEWDREGTREFANHFFYNSEFDFLLTKNSSISSERKGLFLKKIQSQLIRNHIISNSFRKSRLKNEAEKRKKEATSLLASVKAEIDRLE